MSETIPISNLSTYVLGFEINRCIILSRVVFLKNEVVTIKKQKKLYSTLKSTLTNFYRKNNIILRMVKLS